MEICKREGGDPEEKGVDRLLGLGSARCGGLGKMGQDWAVVQNCPHRSVFCSGSAGRVALSREDKEAAKLGLSVFTVNPVNLSAQDPGLGGVWGGVGWDSLGAGCPSPQLRFSYSTTAWTAKVQAPLHLLPGRSLVLRKRLNWSESECLFCVMH